MPVRERAGELALRFAGVTLALASVYFAIKFGINLFTPSRRWLVAHWEPYVLPVAVVPGAALTYLWYRRAAGASPERIHFVIQFTLRVCAGLIVATYALSKLLGGQMYPPFPSTLDSTISELPRHEMTWAYFGSSSVYGLFVGIPQLASALLLLSRRTQLLGALLVVTIFANITAINYAYEFGEVTKILALFILFASMYLVAVDTPRLAGLFWGGRAVAARPHPFGRRGWHFAAAHVAMFVVWMVIAGVLMSARIDQFLHSPTALNGVWDVTERPAPPGATPAPEVARWSRVYFDDQRIYWEEHRGKPSANRHGAVRDEAGVRQQIDYRIRADGTFEIELPAATPPGSDGAAAPSPTLFRGRYVVAAQSLTLDGSIEGRRATLSLQRRQVRPRLAK